MSDEAAVGEEFKDNFVRQFFEQWINPEIKRRREADLLPEGFNLGAAQVVMNFGRPTAVRLNEEVKAVVKGKFVHPVADGERVSLDQLEHIDSVELTEFDPDAGHMTILRYGKGWFAGFDFQYNVARSRQSAHVARQYLDSAATSLTRGQLNPFADSLLSAVELMARAVLLSHALKLLDSRPKNKHPLIASRYQTWASLGNTDPRFAELLSGLWALRPAARYLESDLSMTTDEAADLLNLGEEMYQHVIARIPSRGLLTG